jgi:cytochrome c-type protein NapC
MSDNSENTTQDAKGKGMSAWLKRTLIFGVPLTGAAIFFVFGIIFWGGFNTAMEATNTMTFCISCHEMENNVYEEYKPTIHHQNRTGVRATCSDCHVPDPWIHKMVRKVEASKEVWGKITGTINTKEKFEAKRLYLAKRVWNTMKNTDSRECRNCHNFESMAPEFQKPRARKQHLNAFKTGQTCIDCHKGIAHKNIRDLLTDEELEALEAPNPDFIREVPETYLASLKKIEEIEAAQAKAEEEAKKAAADAVKAKIAKAVEAAVAKEQAKAAAAASGGSSDAAAAPSGDSIAGNVDWNAVDEKSMTLFYPGQASFEWVQYGKNHGGARPVTKAGDRCTTCHAKELKDMGAKIVSGEKAEETPIPGKRGHIDLTLQATHDKENLYIRMQWENGPHNPVPFVDGGKMDPENEVKVAMMIAGNDIKLVEQAGCWATCHHDSRYMPHAPAGEDIAKFPEVGERINVKDGVTKYLAESRTKVEVKGRRGKKRGGWEKLKDQGDLDGQLANGAFMDLMRYVPTVGGVNSSILAERKVDEAKSVMAEGKLEGDTWTVVLKRPLKASGPGDIALEPGKTYTVGFAIHDDYTSARFHHVSLEYKLALDNPEAEINVVGK